MSASIFTIELSQIDYSFVTRFCELEFPEGPRIEYKREFPSGLNLEKTICAMGNTLGGVILIGVEADKTTNKPIDILGIKLVKGLEEKVVNMCITNIYPPLVPAVRICEFSSDPATKPNDRAIIFIRVPLSYRSPHQIIRTKEILVRAHNRNTLADLNTIERLIKRRDETTKLASPSTLTCNYRYVETEDKQFESVVMSPSLILEPIILFNKQTDEWLSKATENVMFWNERKPGPNKLELLHLTGDRRIRGFCLIRDDGHIVFQKPTEIQDGSISIYSSMIFLISVLKTAKRFYSHFGFYGEISIGFTICGVENVKLGFPKRRHLFDEYVCERPEIYIQRSLKLDEFDDLKSILEDIFRELCRWFGLVLEEKVVSEIVAEIFSSTR